MNFKTTAVLIVLLAALASFVFLMRDKGPSYADLEQARLTAGEGKALFGQKDIAAADITRLSITQDGRTAQLVKTSNDWRQAEPVDFPLAPMNVEDVVNEVLSLKYTDHFTPGQKDYPAAAKLGLEPALTQITLAGSQADKPSHRINVGRTIVGGKAYISLDDAREVYVVSDQLAKLLADQPVRRWRQKTLTAPGENQTDQLILTAADGVTTMTKAQGQWQFQSPDAGRVDRQAVTAMLGAIGQTQAVKFVADAPENLAEYGLSAPTVQLVVVSSRPGTGPDAAKSVEKVTQTLRIGAPADLENSQYFATWTRGDAKPAVFTVSKEALAKFNRDKSALRDPRLTPLKQNDIKQLTLVHDGQKLALTHSAKGWQFDDAKLGFQADDSGVSELVASIINARAIHFVTPDKSATVLAEIHLASLGQASPDVLRISETQNMDKDKDKANAKHWLVVRNDEPVGEVIDADKLQGVLAAAWTLRDKEIADLPAEKINRIQISHADGKKVDLGRTLPSTPAAAGDKASDKPGPWKLADATDVFDDSLPAKIVMGLSPLRIKAWRDPQAKLGEGTSELVVTTSDGKTLDLKMDSKGHALLTGVEQSFDLPDALRDAVLASYHNQTVLGLGHAQVRQIVREAGGDRVTIQVNEDGKFESGGAKLQLDQSSVAVLLDTLLGLHAEGWMEKPKAEAISALPEATFTLTDKQGKAVTLAMYTWIEKQAHVGVIDGKWFAIPAATGDKLKGSLLSDDAAQ